MVRQNSINRSTSQLTVDPSASSDSFIQFSINSSDTFRMGSDQSASSAFKLSSGSALGVNDRFIVATTGEQTCPSQPAFSTQIAARIDNVTGDGTTYTVAWANVIFQRGSIISGSTFTVPAGGGGVYVLLFALWMNDINGAMADGKMEIQTSNRTYGSHVLNYGASCQFNNEWSNNMEALDEMDAGDTAVCKITVSGSALVVDVGITGRSYFSGLLVA